MLRVLGERSCPPICNHGCNQRSPPIAHLIGSLLLGTMVKPSYRTGSLCLYHKGYQQALEDFVIPHLLTRLKTYCDADFDAAWMNLTQPELESLAAILIRQL